MQRQQYLGLLDMLDGGGPGRAGSTFEGGPLSGLLNLLGIRPMGYADRMAQAPTASPMAPAPMGGGMAPPAPRRAPAAPRMMAPALTGPAGGPRPGDFAAKPHYKTFSGTEGEVPRAYITPAGWVWPGFEEEDGRRAYLRTDLRERPGDFAAQATARELAAARPAGTDPTRDPEFASWFKGTTGTDVGVIPPQTLRAVYDKWLAARMGAR